MVRKGAAMQNDTPMKDIIQRMLALIVRIIEMKRHKMDVAAEVDELLSLSVYQIGRQTLHVALEDWAGTVLDPAVTHVPSPQPLMDEIKKLIDENN